MGMSCGYQYLGFLGLGETAGDGNKWVWNGDANGVRSLNCGGVLARKKRARKDGLALGIHIRVLIYRC